MTNHGGARPGSGRKRISPSGELTVKKQIVITPEDLTYLLTVNTSLSHAIRILVAKDKER